MPKLTLQERFAELGQRPNILSNDIIWESLLSYSPVESNYTVGEFYGMVSVAQVRCIRGLQPANLEMLVVKTVERLEGLTKAGMIGTKGTVLPQLNNCCRIISRVFPVLYEEKRSTDFLWNDKKYGERTLAVLRSLMHLRGYTTPHTDNHIWYRGIGCPVAATKSPHEFSSERLTVVTALLSVLSEQMYVTSYQALDYWTTTIKDPAVLCSLLNITLGSDLGMSFTQQTPHLVALSLGLLLVSLTHKSNKKNQFRRLLSKLHKPQDIEWLASNIESKLSEAAAVPQSATSMVVAAVQPLRRLLGGDNNEMSVESSTNPLWVAVAWEMVQANRTFAQSNSLRGLALQLVARLTPEQQQSDPQAGLGARLSSHALCSLTVDNSSSAEAVGASVWRAVMSNASELDSPSYQLASHVDVLWNCAPHLVLTSSEAAQFKTVLSQLRAAPVKRILFDIARVMQFRNPGLELPKEEGDSPSNVWAPIQFQWDDVRMRWYSSIFWGVAVQLEPRVWQATKLTLFKVVHRAADQPAVYTAARLAASKLSEYLRSTPEPAGSAESV